MSELQVVYRMYNIDGSLLYVGVTNNFGARFGDHWRTKPWIADVKHLTLQPFASRSSAEEAERQAILNEKPLHNVLGKSNPLDRQFNLGMPVKLPEWAWKEADVNSANESLQAMLRYHDAMTRQVEMYRTWWNTEKEAHRDCQSKLEYARFLFEQKFKEEQ